MIHEAVRRQLRRLGYAPCDVPFGPVERRADFVLAAANRPAGTEHPLSH